MDCPRGHEMTLYDTENGFSWMRSDDLDEELDSFRVFHTFECALCEYFYHYDTTEERLTARWAKEKS
jgi:hypothetical protein